jgi:hypothetical protein
MNVVVAADGTVVALAGADTTMLTSADVSVTVEVPEAAETTT